jgi:hypothetical protein
MRPDTRGDCADESVYEGVRKRHIRNSLDFGYLEDLKIGLPLVESIHSPAPGMTTTAIPTPTTDWNPEPGPGIRIGYQRRWEVAGAFGTFATPTALLINEAGRIADLWQRA